MNVSLLDDSNATVATLVAAQALVQKRLDAAKESAKQLLQQVRDAGISGASDSELQSIGAQRIGNEQLQDSLFALLGEYDKRIAARRPIEAKERRILQSEADARAKAQQRADMDKAEAMLKQAAILFTNAMDNRYARRAFVQRAQQFIDAFDCGVIHPATIHNKHKSLSEIFLGATPVAPEAA